LFDLDYEDAIFQRSLKSFLEYQRHHEGDLLSPGTGFHLVKSLLALNSATLRRVEVIIMSRNHPDVYLRVSNSIRHHKLDISRTMLTGGEPLNRYLKEYKFDLLLSADDNDVTSALEHGITAGRIYRPPNEQPAASDQIRIAFDGDCVLFSDEAEAINQREGLEAFHEHERTHAAVPLPDGPFAKLIRAIAQMQGEDPATSPFRIGLVTARNAPAHERAIRTLRDWNVRVDGAAFLGGLPKGPWLAAFQPHIFFDDQDAICTAVSPLVPTARVLFPVVGRTALIPLLPTSTKDVAQKDRFLLICRGYVKSGTGRATKVLEDWYLKNLAACDVDTSNAFLDELEGSIEGTPIGSERPSRGGGGDREDKLLPFLDSLIRKHRVPGPSNG
jgi:5'-nucleotidase